MSDRSGGIPGASLIVPVHNNAGTLTELRDRILESLRDRPVEIIMVNDGSRDDSLRVMEGLGVRIVDLPYPHGQSAAVLRGLALARFPTAGVLDADLEDPPEALPRMFEALGKEGAQIVFSARRTAQRLTSRLFRALMHACFPRLPVRSGLCFAIDAASREELLEVARPGDYLLAVIGALGMKAVVIEASRGTRPGGGTGYPGWKRWGHGFRCIGSALRFRLDPSRVERRRVGTLLPDAPWSPRGLRWRCARCGAAMQDAGTSKRPCERCHEPWERVHGVWSRNPDFRPAGFPDERREHLTSLEASHFWFGPRLDLLEKRLPARAARALELGCGSGTFLSRLSRHAGEIVALEGHLDSALAAQERCPDATVLHGSVLECPLDEAQFDLVVALDVIEHTDGPALLAEADRLARRGAHLLLSAPAFPFLWSATDRDAGHRKRYTLPALLAELHGTSWQVIDWTHYQFFLFPLLCLSRRLGRHRPPMTERAPPAWAGRLLGAINALEVRLLGRARLPAGSSLVAVARKLGSTDHGSR